VTFILLSHIDPLLGNDGETNMEVMAVPRERTARKSGGTVGSCVLYGSTPRLYDSTDQVQFG
jgi:hypothetical protein